MFHPVACIGYATGQLRPMCRMQPRNFSCASVRSVRSAGEDRRHQAAIRRSRSIGRPLVLDKPRGPARSRSVPAVPVVEAHRARRSRDRRRTRDRPVPRDGQALVGSGRYRSTRMPARLPTRPTGPAPSRAPRREIWMFQKKSVVARATKNMQRSEEKLRWARSASPSLMRAGAAQRTARTMSRRIPAPACNSSRSASRASRQGPAENA